jgi:hypothetical protein
MFKKAKCILLPTEEESNLFLKSNAVGRIGLECNAKRPIYGIKHLGWTYQHLYIISDDEIKEGDWYLVELFDITGKSTGNHLEQCNSIDDVWVNHSGVELTRHIGNCKKIIATTDSSLKIIIPRHNDFDSEYSLPQLSQSFIEKYITEYNRGQTITEIMVEYIQNFDNRISIYPDVWQPKIDKDNTITIKKVKESWNREEIIDIVWKFVDNFVADTNTVYQQNKIDKWIEENL